MADRPEAVRMVGDIYLGRVEAVLPGIQAAFVDLGLGKAAFLHVSDVAPERDEADEEVGDGEGENRSQAAPAHPGGGAQGAGPAGAGIQGADRHQGAARHRAGVASRALPGVHPRCGPRGVSRKIEGREERARLKALARGVLPENSGGVIIRTVGEELTHETFERELKSLMGTWKGIQKRAGRSRAPAVVHREAKLIAGIIRDLFSQKVDSLTVDTQSVYDEVRQYLNTVDPSLVERVHLYREARPLFDERGIETEIHAAVHRRVDLPPVGI